MSIASISQCPNPFTGFMEGFSQITIPAEVDQFFSQVCSLLPSGEFWQTKVVTPLCHFLPTIPDFLMGSMWGGVVLINSSSLCLDAAKYAAISKEGPLVGDLLFRLDKVWYKAIKDLTQFVGSLGHLTEWMHQVKWIQAGVFAPLLKSLGYGSTLVASGVGIFSRVQDLISVDNHLGHSHSDMKKERLRDHQRYCWLEIATNVSTVAWASLGLLGLVVSSPIVSGLFLTAIAASVSLFFLSFCYKRNLDLTHATDLSKRCCEMYA